MRRNRLLILSIVINLSLLIISFPTSLFSAEEAEDLGQIVVSARAIEEPLEKTAHSIQVVTGEEIQRRVDRSVGEALRELPGVSVQALGTRGERFNIRLRGANTGDTLVLLDGVRINDPLTNETNLGLIPVELIERIEILRGSQAVLYGASAVGGVIYITTNKGTEDSEIRLSFEGGNLGHVRELLSWTNTIGSINYALAISRTDEKGQFKNDYFQETAFTQRWDFNPNSNLKITLVNHFFFQEKDLARGFLIGPAPLYDPVLAPEGFFAQITREFNRETQYFATVNSLKVEYDWNDLLKTEFTYGFFLQDLKEDNSNIGDPGSLTPSGALLAPSSVENDIKVYRYNANLRQFFFLPDLGRIKHSLLVGFEFYNESINSSGVAPFPGDPPPPEGALGPFILPITTIPSDEIPGSRQNYAPYLLYHLDYNDRVFFDAGFRWDYNSAYGGEISPRLGVAVNIHEINGKIHFAYGEGFLPPTNLQLFNPITGNPDLSPQTSQSYEAGYNQNFGKNASLYATFFYIDFDNLIDRVGQNTADAYSLGLEAGFQVKPIPQFTIGANYTFNDTEDESGEGGRLANIPTHSFHAFVSANPWKTLKIDTSLTILSDHFEPFPFVTVDGEFVDGTAAESLDGGNVDGYIRWDIAASYQFKLRHYHGKHPQSLKIFGKANNILNQKYEERFGFPLPRFHFIAGAEILF